MVRKLVVAALAAGLVSGVALADAVKNPLKKSATWTELSYDVIGDAAPADGSGLFAVDAPYRAHDAAIVPVHIKQSPTSAERITSMTVVVDENPAPVVAEFEFGPAMGHIDLEMRVRVDLYSNVRVVAQTDDGNTWMNGRFVKASGGCSAPALKGMEAALANAGKMRFRVYEPEIVQASTSAESSARKQAQVMIRHPNYSGMQRNQVTNLFIPAFFVQELDVYQGDELLWRMEGGISISEDPVFRFSFTPNGAEAFRVRAVDTDGNVFEKTFPVEQNET